MTEDDARALLERRRAEQPQFNWTAQPRGDEWVVVRLPGTERIDPKTVHGERGEQADLADDPRAANVRNTPPYGAGICARSRRSRGRPIAGTRSRGSLASS